MAMIKFVSPAGWDYGQPISQLIKIGSRGLIGNDRREFLKIASHSFIDQLDNIKFAKDEVPVHLIALGASEAWGPNRNGDGFKEATCKQHHDTFVKFAKFFRNHRNKPEKGDPHYGTVKASAYNEDMRRVELIAALNAEKSATDRNGGFIADKELEKIARGEDIPVSMACRVPYDTCSYCHNNARTRDEYCTREKCAAGGCKDNLTRLVKVGNDLIHMHVDNPNPTWFDISNVYRPADRIAYGAKADYLTKAGNDSGMFELQDYIKMAEHSSAPLDVILYQSGRHGFWSEKYASQVRLGYALAAIETNDNCSDANAYRAFVTPAFPIEKLASYGSRECDSQLAALADRKVILNLRDFARLTHQEHAVKSAASILPGIYTRMTADESLPLLVENGACSFIDKTANEDARTLAATAYEAHTLEKQAVDNRTLLSCIRERPVPAFSLHESASCDAHGEKLASNYAMYKLAALWRAAASDKDFPLTVRMSLRQNRVLSYG